MRLRKRVRGRVLGVVYPPAMRRRFRQLYMQGLSYREIRDKLKAEFKMPKSTWTYYPGVVDTFQRWRHAMGLHSNLKAIYLRAKLGRMEVRLQYLNSTLIPRLKNEVILAKREAMQLKRILRRGKALRRVAKVRGHYNLPS